MARGFSIRGEVQGLAAVTATLKALPEKLQRKVMRKALSKATKPTLMAAKRLAPKDLGLLRKSIGRKVVTYKDSGVLVVVIGPRTGFGQVVRRQGQLTPRKADPVYYGHLVEFGTKPHAIGNRMHPGSVQQPFLRPAFDQTKAEVARIYGEEVAAGLTVAVAKH